MRDEVVDGHFDALKMFESLECLAEQLEVERVRMVKIIVVTRCLVMHFEDSKGDCKNLEKRIKYVKVTQEKI